MIKLKKYGEMIKIKPFSSFSRELRLDLQKLLIFSSTQFLKGLKRRNQRGRRKWKTLKRKPPIKFQEHTQSYQHWNGLARRTKMIKIKLKNEEIIKIKPFSSFCLRTSSWSSKTFDLLFNITPKSFEKKKSKRKKKMKNPKEKNHH